MIKDLLNEGELGSAIRHSPIVSSEQGSVVLQVVVAGGQRGEAEDRGDTTQTSSSMLQLSMTSGGRTS